MNFCIPARNTLIVSGTENCLTKISELLDTDIYYPISVALTAADAKKALSSDSYDLVIIDAPLSDESGEDLAISISITSLAGIILLVKKENYNEITADVDKYGVFSIAKPMTKQTFYHTLNLINSTQFRWKQLQNETQKLQNQIEDIKIISRAKCVLAAYLQMSETQAHHYIEKQSMAMRISKRSVAESIIKTYEN